MLHVRCSARFLRCSSRLATLNPANRTVYFFTSMYSELFSWSLSPPILENPPASCLLYSDCPPLAPADLPPRQWRRELASSTLIARKHFPSRYSVSLRMIVLIILKMPVRKCLLLITMLVNSLMLLIQMSLIFMNTLITKNIWREENWRWRLND